MSSSTVFEIVELPSGEIALRKSEGEDPLICIRFSDDAHLALGKAIPEIGKAMITTGIQLIGKMFEQDNEEEKSSSTRVLH